MKNVIKKSNFKESQTSYPAEVSTKLTIDIPVESLVRQMKQLNASVQLWLIILAKAYLITRSNCIIILPLLAEIFMFGMHVCYVLVALTIGEF